MIAVDAVSVIGFVLSIVFLGYAAYSDLKTREVSNHLWTIYLPLATVVLISRLLLDPKLLVLSVASIAVTTCLSIVMFYIGIFGGADAKAFICLSVALPTNPFPLESLFISLNPIFPLTVLYTTYLLSLSTVFLVVIKNLKWKYGERRNLFKDLPETPTSKRVIALLTGYKTDFRTLQEKVYLYPMEEVSRDSEGHQKKLKFFTNAEVDRNEAVRNLGDFLTENDKQEVWVTPGIPLLLFTWVALILNAFLGDILMWIFFH